MRLLPAIIALAFTTAAGAESQLPDFGSSAGSILTPQQERSLGRGMFRELRGQNLIQDDPVLNEYLENLGYRLVAVSEKPEEHFTFFIVNDPSINAFATPGGYVGMNVGLIEMAENESEIAAVLSHEIAHVTQRHLVRAYESLSKVALPIQLAMLGALLAASQGGSSSGDAAQAVIVGGQALIQQQAINFTRDNEYEADRIGIHTLAKAGFQPDAMADFFNKMGHAVRKQGEAAPDFLMTHPVSTTRIAEAKSRAAKIPQSEKDQDGPEYRPVVPSPLGLAAVVSAKAAKAPPSDPPAFLLFRERVRVLSGADARTLTNHYEKAPDTPANRYGKAIALSFAGHMDESRELLEGLVERYPQNMTLQLALARAEADTGDAEAAGKRLDTLAEEHPGNRIVTQAQAEYLMLDGNREDARRAADLLRPLVAERYEDVSLQLAFARASEMAGDEVRAGEAHAEVALLSGRISDALWQLQGLIKRPDVDYYSRARIEARIQDVTPYALDQRKKMAPEQRLGLTH